MDIDLNRRCREVGKTFYCPNGHGQVYKTTELAKAKEMLENARRRSAMAENRADWLARDLEAAKRSKAAIKGQLTKTRKRIANGVCPCCNRTFKQLDAHMTNKHPDFVKAVG
ncbi:MAG TPA: hypothetical protein VGB67_00570 [Fibrella sp.]|jgi:hypothetical protein